MSYEEYRCPIHTGYLCFSDNQPFEHNIRLKAGARPCSLPKLGHEFIYKITHVRTEIHYIGRTEMSLSQRWEGHRSARKQEMRRNAPLYRAMNADGLQMFVMEALEECEKSVVNARELDYMRLFDSWNPQKGFNSVGEQAKYFRELCFLRNPDHRLKYDELRLSLDSLWRGFREPLPQDQKLEEELRQLTDTLLSEGRELIEANAWLTGPLFLDPDARFEPRL